MTMPQTDPRPFNPLELHVIASSVEREMLKRQKRPLAEFAGRGAPFAGYGIYAIYYNGAGCLYTELANTDVPIYVGKASVYATRRGDAKAQGLYARITKHRASIGYAENLNIDEFRARYLVVEDAFVPMAEALMIRKYRPVWNTAISGFGINAPGQEGRGQQQRSAWDTLHPGRPFAAQLPPNNLAPDMVANMVTAHFATTVVVEPDSIAPIPDGQLE